MREIEFRAWHKIRKKMYIVMNLTRAEQTPLTLIREFIDSESEAVLTEELEIMQYIGLKDKNGKEIFEGDVVKHKSWGVDDITEVKFQDGGFYPFAAQSEGLADAEESEIIGNSHTTPELVL